MRKKNMGTATKLSLMAKIKRSKTLILMCVPAIVFFIAFH